MSDNQLTIHDRLEEILESINLIQEWSKGRTSVDDYMLSPTGVMAFNACVMRFQVIGEHVGKLLKSEEKLLDAYPNIPWPAIYGLRNVSDTQKYKTYKRIYNEMYKLYHLDPQGTKDPEVIITEAGLKQEELGHCGD